MMTAHTQLPFPLKAKGSQTPAECSECKMLKYNALAVTTGGAREFNNS